MAASNDKQKLFSWRLDFLHRSKEHLLPQQEDEHSAYLGCGGPGNTFVEEEPAEES